MTKKEDRDYLTRGEIEEKRKQLLEKIKEVEQTGEPVPGWTRFRIVWHSVTCMIILIVVLCAVAIGIYLACVAGIIC